MGIMQNTDGYRPGEECSHCKGRCCREKGCSLALSDLERAIKKRGLTGNKREKILSLLQEDGNLYAIDRFHLEGKEIYYMRMRHHAYTFVGEDAIGICAALTAAGCILSEEDRPKGGRYLESRPDGHCIQHYGADEMAEDWLPYQESLSSIYWEYFQRFKEDGTFDKCDEEYFRFLRTFREGSVF